MAVQLSPPRAEDLLVIEGIELGFAQAGIRRADRRDLMLMRVNEYAQVAGVFTQNSFAAAPVQVCREHLALGKPIRALLVNSGNANCGTGARGLAAARQSCVAVARLLGCAPDEVLPFSTGVILEPLPIERIEAALPQCFASLAANQWADAAAAIMTTDTVPKAASRRIVLDGAPVNITGIAKGVGMLQPDMATMLAYLATDAQVPQPLMRRLVREVADASFNRVTVDGDTSTNDSFILIATGRATHAPLAAHDSVAYEQLRSGLIAVAEQLAQAIARDGEGATKFITVNVSGARDQSEALRVAKLIAQSPLVKTAFFASDPNLGRLIMAIGNARLAQVDTGAIDLFLGDVKVIEHGERAASYTEAEGARVMKEDEITVHVRLGRGAAAVTVWTCDFSYDYVKINAEYRT